MNKKPLDPTEPRCEGRSDDDQCVFCERRTTPPSGMWQPWMQPPEELTCEWRIEPSPQTLEGPKP
jgi:hypothetical protein